MKWLQKIIRNQCDSRKSAFTKLLEEGSREVSSKYGVPHVVTGVVLEKHPHQGKTSLAPRFLYNKGGQKDESSHSSWLKTYGEDTMNDASLMHWVDVKSCTYKYRHLQEIKVNIYHGYPHRISPQGSPILFFARMNHVRSNFCKTEPLVHVFFVHLINRCDSPKDLTDSRKKHTAHWLQHMHILHVMRSETRMYDRSIPKKWQSYSIHQFEYSTHIDA